MKKKKKQTNCDYNRFLIVHSVAKRNTQDQCMLILYGLINCETYLLSS